MSRVWDTDPSQGGGVRRLGRWTFNGLTVLSLVLSVGTAALWVRSYAAQDWAYYRRDQSAVVSQMTMYRRTGYELHSRRGRQTLVSFFEVLEPQEGFGPPGFVWPEPGPPNWGVRSDQQSGPPFRG